MEPANVGRAYTRAPLKKSLSLSVWLVFIKDSHFCRIFLLFGFPNERFGKVHCASIAHQWQDLSEMMTAPLSRFLFFCKMRKNVEGVVSSKIMRILYNLFLRSG